MHKHPEQVLVHKTSDGKFFEDLAEATLHQDRVNFRTWCRDNICRGGEWTSDMVASAILDHWVLSSKTP